jgi:hypothetical protein
VPLHTTRPSLLDLWARYHFQSRTLADLAGVPEQTIWAMFYCQPVHRADAQKVLLHLSILLHKIYTLSTVAVVLSDQEAPMELFQTRPIDERKEHIV